MPESNSTEADTPPIYSDIASPNAAPDCVARLASTLPPKEKRANLTPVGPLILSPISRQDAFSFIAQHHRHHAPPQGWKFGTSVTLLGETVGVIVVSNPVARSLQDGLTLEITRCCTTSLPHAASKLYGAACRAAFALGYTRIVTYTLTTESGSSLLASGFTIHSYCGPKSWSTPSRPRSPSTPVDRILWQRTRP